MGIIDVSVTLDDFQTLVASADVGDLGAGYVFIIAQTGVFISHPISSFVKDTKTIHDFDDSLRIETLQLAVDSTSEDFIVVDHVDVRSGQLGAVASLPPIRRSAFSPPLRF